MSRSAPWHQPHPKAESPKKRADAFYKSARWLRFRLYILARNPLCADPFEYHNEDGVAVPATEVHHVKPRKAHPELAFDADNVQALCRSCHARITHG